MFTNLSAIFLLLLACGVQGLLAQQQVASSEFLHQKHQHYVPHGSTVKIHCDVKDNKADVFLWHKISKDLPAYEMAVNGGRLNQHGMVFTFVNLSYHDNGVYYCEAVFPDGRREKKEIAEIVVKNVEPEAIQTDSQGINYGASLKIRTSKPFVLFDFKSPVQVPVSETKEFKLSIKLMGLQPIQTKWRKDIMEIYSAGLRIKTAKNGQQLVIKPPFSPELSGSYEVMACNLEGCTVRGIQILFYDPNDKTGLIKAYKEIIYTGIALVIVSLVAVVVTLLIMKYMGLICKSTKEKLTEETKKIKKQLQRGQNSKSGSIWSWKACEDNSAGCGTDVPDYDDEQLCKQENSQTSSLNPVSNLPPIQQTPWLQTGYVYDVVSSTMTTVVLEHSGNSGNEYELLRGAKPGFTPLEND